MNRTRTARLVALPVLAVALLSACDAGPVQAGAAATIGTERIGTTTLQQVVDRGLADTTAQQQLGADRSAFQRQVLSRLITGDLLAVAARSKGVTVSEGEVDARLADLAEQLGGTAQLQTQAAQSGIAPKDLRPFVRDLALNDALGDRLVAGTTVPAATLSALYQKNIAQYDQVRARHILLKTAAEAQQVLAQVTADPSRFAAIATARSLDEGSKANGGELAPAGRGAYVKPFEDALFSAKPDVPGIVQTEFGYHVYEVLERRTTTLQQALPALRREALQPQREAALSALLRTTARDEHVVVNPRFGRWDGKTGTVVEAVTTGASGFSRRPPAARSPRPPPTAPGASRRTAPLPTAPSSRRRRPSRSRSRCPPAPSSDVPVTPSR